MLLNIMFIYKMAENLISDNVNHSDTVKHGGTNMKSMEKTE